MKASLFSLILVASALTFTAEAKWTLDVSKTVYTDSYVVYNDDGPDGAPTWVINVDSYPNAQNINAKEFCLWTIRVQETNVLDLTTFEADTGRSIHGIGGTSFQGNAKLEEVIAPDLKFVGYNAGANGFFNCANLKNVYLPNLLDVNGSNFKNCTSLREIVLPNCTNLQSSAFSGCTALTNAVFSEKLEAIDQLAFSGCTALKSFTPFLPKGMTKLGASAFKDCTALENDLVYDCPAIAAVPKELLQNCAAVSNVLFKSDVRSFGDSAFSGIAKDANVFFRQDTPPDSFNASSWYPAFGKNGTNATVYRNVFRVRDVTSKPAWVRYYTQGDWTTYFTNRKTVDGRYNLTVPDRAVGVIVLSIHNVASDFNAAFYVCDDPAPGLMLLLK